MLARFLAPSRAARYDFGVRLVPLRLLIAPLLLLAAACSGSAPAGAKGRPAPLVAVARPEVRDVPVEVRAPVDLRPLAQADVGSKTLGYLDAVLVDRGDRVKRGQILALVRPSDLPDQLAAARSALAQAQAASTLARANKDRAERLAPGGIVSQQELQQVVTASASSESALAAAQSQASALAVRLGETRIESPLDGLVTQRRLDPGALVGPTAGTGSILSVARVDVLRAFIPVNEREIQLLKIDQEAHVELDAFAGKIFSGRVVRLAPGLDAATRTLDAEVQLPNPGGELRPGMYGRGSIVVATHPKAVVVPAGAVQITNGHYFLFIAKGDKVRRAPVKIGVDGGAWLEVVEGLAPEDEVVTAGADGLSDGAQVRVRRDVNPYTGAVAGEAPAAPGRN